MESELYGLGTWEESLIEEYQHWCLRKGRHLTFIFCTDIALWASAPFSSIIKANV